MKKVDPRGPVERAAAEVTRRLTGKTKRSVSDSPSVMRAKRAEDDVTPVYRAGMGARPKADWMPGDQASGGLGRAFDVRVAKKLKDAGA